MGTSTLEAMRHAALAAAGSATLEKSNAANALKKGKVTLQSVAESVSLLVRFANRLRRRRVVSSGVAIARQKEPSAPLRRIFPLLERGFKGAASPL